MTSIKSLSEPPSTFCTTIRFDISSKEYLNEFSMKVSLCKYHTHVRLLLNNIAKII